MLISAPQLERRAIRTLASSNSKIASTLLGQLDIKDFHKSPNQAMFRRIMTLSRKRGRTPEWEELLHDPVIDEPTRKLFATYKKRPWPTLEIVKRRAEQLHKFRKLRQIFDMLASTEKILRSESLDLDKLLDSLSDQITQARISGDIMNSFINIGKKNDKKWLKIVDEILDPNKPRFIKTGFNAFDSVNGGIFRGSVFTICSSSGGGKSTLAQIIALNMARFGARVALVSLEMDRSEMIRRMVANLSGVPMSKLIKPDELSDGERTLIKNKARRFHKIIGRIDALYSIVTPEDDVSMEEVLNTTKAYDYDVIIIDMLNLLSGLDEAEQWRKLGSATRFAKRFATINNNIIIPLAQLSDEGLVKYSRAIVENSTNLWKWKYGEDSKTSHIIDVYQEKARNQKAFPFQLLEDFDRMRITDFEGKREFIAKKKPRLTYQNNSQQPERAYYRDLG
jgi:replicative DNA helicase